MKMEVKMKGGCKVGNKYSLTSHLELDVKVPVVLMQRVHRCIYSPKRP